MMSSVSVSLSVQKIVRLLYSMLEQNNLAVVGPLHTQPSMGYKLTPRLASSLSVTAIAALTISLRHAMNGLRRICRCPRISLNNLSFGRQKWQTLENQRVIIELRQQLLCCKADYNRAWFGMQMLSLFEQSQKVSKKCFYPWRR